MNDNPLVSVGVLTYNSSKTVVETLESIKAQTYHNIELIVSDDCSKDNTVEICREWINKNKDRFARTELLTVNQNTGISANANRRIKASQGYYSKGIAGDDLLLEDCITSYVSYAQDYPDVNVFFSRIRPFSVVNGRTVENQSVPLASKDDFFQVFNDLDAHDQFRQLLIEGCFVPAPSSFWKTEFLKNHLFPEMYKYEEDYPMWLRLTHEGNKMRMLFKDTVLYRKGESLSTRGKDYYSKNYMYTRSLFFWNEFVHYAKDEKIDRAHNRYRKDLLKYELTEAFTQNHKSKFNDLLVKVINHLVDRFGKYEF